MIACSELSMIGQRWAEHVPVVNGASGAMVSSDGKTFKALNGSRGINNAFIISAILSNCKRYFLF